MGEFFLSRNQLFDATGNVLDSGTIGFYTTGTLTFKNVYSDINLTVAAENPVQLSGGGVMPLRYMDGSYRIIIKDKNGTTVPDGDLDPVQGNPELSGALSTWNTAVIYSALNTVQGNDGLYYHSLISNNVANDPTTDAVSWREIRFIDVWNTNATYAIGVIVQDSTGNLWRSKVSQSGNDPTLDDGTNWVIASNEQWTLKPVNFTLIANKQYMVDASGGTVDIALPAAAVIGDRFVVKNESISTNAVKITNTGAAYTIKGERGTVTSADDLVIPAGRTAYLIAKTTLILEAT